MLAVFVPIYMAASFHVHDPHRAETQCEACLNHQEHTGHIVDTTLMMGTCLLCQFLSLPFCVATVAAFCITRETNRNHNTINGSLALGARLHICLRGPPALAL